MEGKVVRILVNGVESPATYKHALPPVLAPTPRPMYLNQPVSYSNAPTQSFPVFNVIGDFTSGFVFNSKFRDVHSGFLRFPSSVPLSFIRDIEERYLNTPSSRTHVS